MDGNDGFMGFWADIDPDFVLRYQEWHNCEHIRERVSMPGFVEGRRYRGVAPGPMFFMCYVTDEPAALRSKAYLAALDRPTPWTQEALKHFRNPSRNVYHKIEWANRAPASEPYLVVQLFNDARPQADLRAALARCLEVSGLPAAGMSVALYEIDNETSNIKTAERAIYDGGPGSQRYLLTLGLRDRPAAERALQDVTTAMRKQEVSSLESNLFWLETRITKADLGQPAALT